MKNNTFDIVIAGAGIVGCMMANMLAKRLPQIKIALIDKQTPNTFERANDIGLRVYALNHASQNLFAELGLWAEIEQQRCCAYQHMQVWQSGQTKSLSFHAADIDQDYLGHIVEHDLLHDRLFQLIQKHSNIHIYCPATVKHLQNHSQHIQLTLDDAMVLRAKLIVAADGTSSAIRQLSDINVHKNSYMQSAIVAVVETEKSHQNTAWQCFLPTGPLAFLPLQDGRSSIVWSLPTQQASEYQHISKPEFAKLLHRHSDARLGDISRVGERAIFPLQHLQAQEYVQSRLALIGDAAHVVHPLAGQGLNLGLNDVSLLMGVLSNAYSQSTDIGQLHILKRYARHSQMHNRIMSEMFGGLNSVFASQHSLLHTLREKGLGWVDSTQRLKAFFIQQAIGKI